MILITGGAGFIGSNFVHAWLAGTQEPLIDLDKLTYAGNLASLADVAQDPRHTFVRGDIGDRELVVRLLETHQPRAIINFAAESHVDRSIHGPSDFIQTNVLRARLDDPTGPARLTQALHEVPPDGLAIHIAPGGPG